MDVGSVLIKLKSDSMEQVEAWRSEIERRKAEAVETLKAEGVTVESWFHLEVNGEQFLIAYMRAHDIAHAQKVGRESTFDIDRVHKRFKAHWEKVYPARLLVDLENPE